MIWAYRFFSPIGPASRGWPAGSPPLSSDESLTYANPP
jgi:hypothetical protein